LGPPGNPKLAWTLYNSTLYLNYLPSINKKFQQDIDTKIATANARWIGWYGELNAGPFNYQCWQNTTVVPPTRDCRANPQVIPFEK
jgi:hypothetical protein